MFNLTMSNLSSKELAAFLRTAAVSGTTADFLLPEELNLKDLLAEAAKRLETGKAPLPFIGNVD